MHTYVYAIQLVLNICLVMQTKLYNIIVITLRSRINDNNLARLMRIATDGLELSYVCRLLNIQR